MQRTPKISDIILMDLRYLKPSSPRDVYYLTPDKIERRIMSLSVNHFVNRGPVGCCMVVGWVIGRILCWSTWVPTYQPLLLCCGCNINCYGSPPVCLPVCPSLLLQPSSILIVMWLVFPSLGINTHLLQILQQLNEKNIEQNCELCRVFSILSIAFPRVSIVFNEVSLLFSKCLDAWQRRLETTQ